MADVDYKYISIWIVNSFDEFKDNLELLIKFFKGGNTSYNNWDEKKVIKILDI